MIWVLPGFLGQSKDFEVLEKFQYKVIPLFEKNHELNINIRKKKWVENFTHYIQEQKQTSNILLGYSFGARLALEVLKSHKDLFTHCVFISANTINLSSEERSARKLKDQKWAHGFLKNDWEQTLKQWNNQAVLKNSTQAKRKKHDFDFKAIELAFTEYSLAEQNLRAEDFKDVNSKLLWLFGEQDSKFVKISKNMQDLSWPGQFLTIPNAGHRLHLDNPEDFLTTLSEFLANKIEML
ncbi:MAG: alpha/beta fold hydrolase [Bdellovibrionales bacterium]|nr:alpha/beta fold hydrolase [Bdellovibrionales bacterium]